MDILFVNGCITPKTTSGAYLLANIFIDEYLRRNPDDRIKQLDLVSEMLTPLSYYDITMRKKGVWQKMNYARQFLEYDKIIFTSPGWEFGSPSILRVYIEHICLPGTTYTRTDSGYNGLCYGKKVLFVSDMRRHILSGISTDLEYLQSVFSLLGVGDFREIHADLPQVSHENSVRTWEMAKEKAEIMAAQW